MKPFFLLILLALSLSCGQTSTTIKGQAFLASTTQQPTKFAGITILVYRAEDIKRSMKENLSQYQLSNDDPVYRDGLDIRPVSEMSAFLFATPRPVAQATSDGDGNFSLDVKESGNLILIARASNSVSERYGHFLWMERVHATGQPITLMLSNNFVTNPQFQHIMSDIDSAAIFAGL